MKKLISLFVTHYLLFHNQNLSIVYLLSGLFSVFSASSGMVKSAEKLVHLDSTAFAQIQVELNRQHQQSVLVPSICRFQRTLIGDHSGIAQC